VEDLFLPGELKIYPVPASLVLHIEYGYMDADDLILELFDANGREVLVKQFPHTTEITETIDVTGMSSGIYYLRLRSDQKQLIRKIAIN
jgi:proteasome assembly chaperone (PAC2) family protein